MLTGSIRIAFVFRNNAVLLPCLNHRNLLEWICLFWIQRAPSPRWQAPVLSAFRPRSGRSSVAAWMPRRQEVTTGGCWHISSTWTGGYDQASGRFLLDTGFGTDNCWSNILFCLSICTFTCFSFCQHVLSSYPVSCTMMLQIHGLRNILGFSDFSKHQVLWSTSQGWWAKSP